MQVCQYLDGAAYCWCSSRYGTQCNSCCTAVLRCSSRQLTPASCNQTWHLVGLLVQYNTWQACSTVCCLVVLLLPWRTYSGVSVPGMWCVSSCIYFLCRQTCALLRLSALQIYFEHGAVAVEGAPSTLGYPSPEVTALEPAALSPPGHAQGCVGGGGRGPSVAQKGQDMPCGPTRHQAERLAFRHSTSART